MRPDHLFFIVLASTVIEIFEFIVRTINKIVIKQEGGSFFYHIIWILLNSALWSYFYYLTN